MIGRVRDRATFEALRRRGRRVRRGPVTIVHLSAPSSTGTGAPSEPSVRVAYGINRKVGNAVVRNRVRRRLRGIMRELDRHPAATAATTGEGLASGTYLVTVRPEAASLPYAELQRHVAAACAALDRGDDRRGSGTGSEVAAGRRTR